MEDPLPKESQPAVVIDENTKDSESAENFQKFIFDLFDKNGILNDLRAYLRGHIVNVLRSARTGEPPTCQKHFTQRLDLTFQALNILVAEYLLRLEFSYSFSVFVSEIPLSNMVFEFAKTLMQSGNRDKLSIRFQDRDVWSILNHLGVKCDSVHASSILEMYKSQEYCPLLLCILKNLPMYDEESVYINKANTSKNSISSSPNSSESLEENTKIGSSKKSSFHNKCRHYKTCRTCQNKITRLKDNYSKSKKNFAKMFQQLETVYEAEVELVREEQQKTVKRCLDNQARELQRRHNEVEMSLKAREVELERNVQQKKKFLWGLARALRDQHEHMTRAMHDVRQQTNTITDKEVSLKTQLAEAEETLRQRAEEMRRQISNELTTLETHLESMRRERENIERERSELEHLRELCDVREREKCTKTDNIDIDDTRSNYEIRNELSILRKCVESMKLEPKCVMERSTMTELSDVTAKLTIVLNNGRDADYNKTNEDIRLGNGQLLNDFKKQKNVNFCQSNLDEIYRERSRSSASSEAGDSAPPRTSPHQRDILQLRQENDRLKAFASQQRDHIDKLSSQQARLQAELVAERFRPSRDSYPLPSRPRTAPAFMPQPDYFLHSVNVSASANAVNYGWRKGAGEELSLFSNTQPRIYLPGDTLPFIGVLHERQSDAKRHLINQWRMLRRTSPVRVISKNRASPGGRVVIERHVGAESSINMNRPTHEQHDSENIQISKDLLKQTDNRETQQGPKKPLTIDNNKNREKSPKSLLRDVKNKLRNKDNLKTCIKSTVKEKSPNSVLHEAKQRLRKLEIEAEAVEKSYMDFRTRQHRLRNEKQCSNLVYEDAIVGYDNRDLDVEKSAPKHKINNTPHEVNKIKQYKDFEKSIKTDFDKYLRDYTTTMSNLETTHFRNRNFSFENTKPIPETCSIIDRNDKINDYLETPLHEFRKLYQSSRPRSPKRERETQLKPPTESTDNKKSSPRKPSLDTKLQEDKPIEHEIRNHNNSVHSTGEEASKLTVDSSETKVNVENSLRIEVESVNAISDVKMTDSQTGDIVLVVESSNDNVEMKSNEISAKMTIIVSPKRTDNPNTPKNTTSEQIGPLTSDDVLDDIFRAKDDDNISNEQMQLSEIKEDAISEEEKVVDEEYPDDFSADVDNYNIRSDYDINSPMSLPKTSEDDNFWDL